jgi:hypothetical protein
MRLAVCATLALTMLTATAVAQPDTFLCIADKSTGFKLQGKQWDIANFKIEDTRYLVKAVPERMGLDGKVNYEITPFGEKYALHECYREGTVEQIACGGLGIGFLMNFRTLRFQEMYGIGYVSGEDDGNNTPYMTIGKCSPL